MPAAPSILIAEDNNDARHALAKILRSEGYRVITAANAHEAIAHAKRLDPDLILLDVSMPPIDGLTVLSQLRDDPHRAAVPVIVLTALTDAHTRRRAAELAVRAYLVKAQYTVPDLLALVKQHARQPA